MSSPTPDERCLESVRAAIKVLEDDRDRQIARVANYTAKYNQGTLSGKELTMAEDKYANTLALLKKYRAIAASLVSSEESQEKPREFVNGERGTKEC